MTRTHRTSGNRSPRKKRVIVASGEWPLETYDDLEPRHAQRLRKAGISPTLAKDHFRSVEADDLARYGYTPGQRAIGGGMLLFWSGLTGSPKLLSDDETPLTQVRFDEPDDSDMRYMFPKGAKGPGFTTHPSAIRSLRNDSDMALDIAESKLKAFALLARRRAAIGMGGVFGYMSNGEMTEDFDLLDEIADLGAREVILWTDSDVWEYDKDQVRYAWRQLEQHLRSRYGTEDIAYVCPPPGRGGKKTDVDSFFAAGHTLEDLLLGYYRKDLPELNRLVSVDWPKDRPDAFYGLPGKIAETFAPYTEADPMALLACALVELGAAIGPGPHIRVGSTQHPAREFVALVGRSAYARKGTAQSEIDGLFRLLLQEWFKDHYARGVASGEGLISALNNLPAKDRRLLLVEEEMSSVFVAKGRQGSTLGSTLRGLWDGGAAQLLKVTGSMKVEDAYLSVICHTTETELTSLLPETDLHNGFANRFLWALVDSTDPKPEAESPPHDKLLALADEIQKVIRFARKLGQVRIPRTKEAEKLWARMYRHLRSARYAGALAAVTQRGDVHVLRLALIHALADRSREIDVEHLRAAFAFWSHCEESAAHVFGTLTGNPLADRIVTYLRIVGAMPLNEIAKQVFGYNYPSRSIHEAIDRLVDLRLARRYKVRKGGRGRPTEWVELL